MADRDPGSAGPIEVLLGHRVHPAVPVDGLGPDAGNTIRPQELDRMLAARPGRMQGIDALDRLRSGEPVRPSTLLTFDDGYRDNLTEALPVLERHGAPAIVFVTTGFVARTSVPAETRIAHLVASCKEVRGMRGRRFDCSTDDARRSAYERLRLQLKRAGGARRDQRIDGLFERNGVEPPRPDDRFLDWDGVRELDRHPLITIGAHTRTHPLLTRLSRDEARLEIEGAKHELEREVGHSVEAFAYPYGGHGMSVRRRVAAAGFRWAFTTDPRTVDDVSRLRPLAVPRIDVRAAAAPRAGQEAS